MRRTLPVLMLIALFFVSSTAALAQGTVTVMGTWGGQELEAFQKVMDAFTERTGIEVQFTGSRDLVTILTTRVEAGNPPDVAAMPNPGFVLQFAREGHLVDLSQFLDMDKLAEQYSQAWIDLGSVDGGLYAIFISADLKSMVWYNPKQFAAKGYEVPTTWDELMALTERIIADGGTPWAIGLESDAASGWPGTDWIEDIILRIGGPELYDQWVNHEIPWTHPTVKRAFEIFGSIARDPKQVYGGPTAVLATNFGDSVNALFTDPPRAYLHRQATFIQSFILGANPGLVAGEDYDFFVLPGIDPEYGTPILGAADMVSVFNDRPEVREFIRFLASPEAQEIWVGELGKLSVNRAVDPSIYPNDVVRKAAQVLSEAEIFRFDGSDLMPSEIGSGAFWTGVLDYVSGADLDDVLEMIEMTAEEVYE